MAEGYCVKCNRKVKMINPVEKINKRGLKYAQGLCPTCNVKVNCILGKA